MIKLIDILLSEKIDLKNVFMKGVGPGGKPNPDQLTDEPKSEERKEYPKGKYIQVTDKKELEKISKEVYDLIDNAYASIGGNVKVKSPKDILDPSTTYWQVADIDDDPELDVVGFGKETKFGTKHTGIGHDGEKPNIKNLLSKKSKDLKTTGNYIEVSGPAFKAYVQIGGAPTLDDEETVRTILGDKRSKQLEWHGQHPTDPSKQGKGWYTRKIGGQSLTKIMAGIPEV